MSSKKKRNQPRVVAVPVTVSPTPKNFPAALVAILAAAAAIRLACLLFSTQNPFYEPLLLDPAFYHQWALRILGGDFGKGVFYGLPLYPFFLAALYKISGLSLFFVKLAQAALGVLTVFFVFKTGERIAEERAGLLAAFFAAIYGPLFFHETVLVPESIGVPLYAAAFFFVCRFIDAPSVKTASCRERFWRSRR